MKIDSIDVKIVIVILLYCNYYIEVKIVNIFQWT